MRIGELSARTGASIRSLRYYEEQGLLASTRSVGGQRHYTEHEVERVEHLQRLYAAGLSSKTIHALLPCMDAPSDETSDAAFVRMVEERDKLTAYITHLAQTRDSLDELLAAHRGSRSRYSSARRK
ncbi:MerR family transcriptional regulator [Micromonospora polyrhachis]|uniref:DNA-binding transcriptional MerR regulator n=1 Tax=Micromonospora polyrhachis TaxID=1282883 RepID=A0A7W7SQH1_9ACTN|nr:MerR family transcriptional regulator [Micromonospora polyrhachis]MBB4959068.1 DNA-binding transcriptional MerR regulator [Micromonospora polyrhachis]